MCCTTPLETERLHDGMRARCGADRSDGPPWSDAMSLVQRYTEVAGYRFHSVHAGTGPPVLLLHGLAGSHRWWRFTVPALMSDFRLHLP